MSEHPLPCAGPPEVSRARGTGETGHLGPSNAARRQSEIFWFDGTDVSIWYKCQTGLLMPEQSSFLPTDTLGEGGPPSSHA